jgi:hypothetical protein
MQNLETLVGKEVSFGVLIGTQLTPGQGTLVGMTIRPNGSTAARLGLIADRAGENVVVPSQPGQGKVIGIKPVSGGKRKTMKKKRSTKH